MNYFKIYDQLMLKAKNRNLPKGLYSEKHHVVPKCMGGQDTKNNLVNLTAEEHFVAHQLLTKMYPTVESLWSAAILMTAHRNGKRVNNKVYAWLKAGYARNKSISMLKTGGPTKDKKWVICLETKISKLMDRSEPTPHGWINGRSLKKHNDRTLCVIAKKEKRKKEFDGRKRLAIQMYKDFTQGSFDSIRSFSKSEKCKFSHVYVIKLWKECLPEVVKTLQHGKPYVHTEKHLGL